MKRALQWAVGLGMSGMMLWLALRNVDGAKALQAMVGVAWWVYPLYILQLCVTYVFRTWRWQLQMDRLTGKRMPFWDAMAICSVSFAGTFLLPFRLGEFIRPYLAKHKGYGRNSTGLAVVAVERVLDGLVMTAFLAAVLTRMGQYDVPRVITFGGYVALAAFGGALVVFVAAYRWREMSMRFWGALLRPISVRLADKLLGVLAAFIEGLKSLPTLRDVAVYLGLTVAYWVVNGLGMWLLTLGMGLNTPLLGGFFSLACLVVGITIPAGPGNVGNFEYAIQVSLRVFGVSDDAGAAYAIWTHLVQMLHMLATALIFMAAGKVSFSGMLPTPADTADDEADVPASSAL